MIFDLPYHLISQNLLARRMMNSYLNRAPAAFRNHRHTLPLEKYILFYGTLMPVIVHRPLAHLHSKKFATEIKKFATRQALITGLADDLYDRLSLPPDRIRSLLSNDRGSDGELLPEEWLCREIYRDLRQDCPGNLRLFSESVQQVMHSQEESLRQKDRRLSPEEILKISREKGSSALLFYRSAIDSACSAEEKDFLRALGGLLQLTNDINDTREDDLEGNHTLMSAGYSIQEILTLFRAQHERTLRKWIGLPSEKYRKNGFWTRINFVLARSYLTLERYARHHPPNVPFRIRNVPDRIIISGLQIPSLLRWFRIFRQLSPSGKSRYPDHKSCS